MLTSVEDAVEDDFVDLEAKKGELTRSIGKSCLDLTKYSNLGVEGTEPA